MPVIGMPVAGVDAGLPGDALHRNGKVGLRTEHVGDLVGGVDEGEHPHPGELLAQRGHQHQGEVAEAGHRTGHIAEHHQLGSGRMRLLQHDIDRHPAGGHRFAQRLAQVDLTAARAAAFGRQPGGQRAGQWLHGLAHLAQLLAGGAQELDVLGQLRHPVHLHVVAAELFGGTALGFGFHHSTQLGDALCRHRLGDLLLRRSRFLTIRGQQPGQ